MLLALLAIQATAPPTAADVHAVEVGRILSPRTDVTHDGQRYVEFGPEIETRNATCRQAAQTQYDCSYEVRIKEFLSRDPGPWASRLERLHWRGGRWHRKPRHKL